MLGSRLRGANHVCTIQGIIELAKRMEWNEGGHWLSSIALASSCKLVWGSRSSPTRCLIAADSSCTETLGTNTGFKHKMSRMERRGRMERASCY
jgi:hypothetical protein